MKHKIIRVALLVLLALLATANVVLASATYYGNIQVSETGSNSYNRLPIIMDFDNTYLAANYYIQPDGLDTRVITSGGTELPWLVADNKLLFVSPITANTITNFKYTLGNDDAPYMPIIAGYNGWITTADDPLLEPANSFEIELSGYFDTSYVATPKYILNKAGSLIWYVSAASELTATLYPIGTVQESQTSSTDAGYHTYDVMWVAQTFKATSSYYIQSVDIYGDKQGTPAGNATVQIRNVSGGVPGSTVYASGSVSASTFGAEGYVNIPVTPYQLTNGTTYAIVFSVPSGAVGDYIHWYLNSPSVYADGQGAYSTDGGGSWAAQTTYDYRFRTYGSTSLLSINTTTLGNSVATGIHTSLKLKATVGGNFEIIDGGVTKATAPLAGLSAYDSNSEWIWCDDNVSPYQDYISLKVDNPTTLHMYYQPVDIIATTVLPDTDGAGVYNGTIHWGDNPVAGVAVSIASFISYNQPQPTSQPEATIPAIVPGVTQPAWIDESTLTANPLYPLVNTLSDLSDFTDRQIWIFLAMGGIMLGMLVTYKFMPHLLIIGIVGTALTGFFCAMGILPFWTVFIFISADIAIWVWERTPSV